MSLGAVLGLSLLVLSYFVTSTLLAGLGAVVFLPIVIYLFLFRFKWLYYLMIFVLPISINLDNVGLGVGLSLPGEALLILVLVGVVWRVIFRFDVYKPIVYHPISLVIFAHLVWMIVSTTTSVLVPVSVKFSLLRSVYILVFYVYGARLFLESGRLQQFISMYAFGCIPVVIYTLTNHYLQGLSYETANRTCYPFFNDHTIYAACIAMIIPVLFALVKNKSKWILNIMFMIVMLVALYFSYSRAGLISGLLGVVLFVIMYFRVKIVWYVMGCIIGLASVCSIFYFVHQNELDFGHGQNDLSEMLMSITDKENYSNSERINRWRSAYAMFEERPFTGFGPGTFMFVYGRYQEGKTFVSVNDSSMGGAHSEYLKPLSEQGILGLLFVIAIMLMVFFKGYQLSISVSGNHRLVIIGCIVALSTYYIHGMFNFFLDTDKASLLFWGLIGYVVAFDVRSKKIES